MIFYFDDVLYKWYLNPKPKHFHCASHFYVVSFHFNDSFDECIMIWVLMLYG